MRNRIMFTLLMLISSISMMYGQGKSVTGVVKDDIGDPLIGVSIQVKGTTTGVITDLDGNYVLPDVPENAVLVFSYIGMNSQEIPVAGQTTIDVVLSEDSELLEEVVVIGYGVTTKRKMVGSVSSIGAEKLEKTTFSNVQSALQGQVAGLVVQSSGGGVNDVPSVSIRGAGAPLYVIDGVVSDEFAFTTLNPEDIETMSFLKDASATAVYGSRAGNGIVLVQTKRGESGAPSIKYSGNFQIGQPTVIADRLDSWEFASMANEVYMRDEGRPYYTDEQMGLIGKDYMYPNNNWPELAFRDFKFEQKHNVSVSGGNEKTNYYVSLGNINNSGILPDNAETLNRTTFRSNVNTVFEEIGLKVNTGINASIQNTREPFEAKWANLLYYIAPTTQGYNPDGTLSSDDLNPLQYFVKDAGYKKYRKKYLDAQLSLTWEPKFTEGLSFGAMANYKDTDYLNREWNSQPERFSWNPETKTSEPYVNKQLSSLSSRSGYNRIFDIEARAAYNNTFGKHSIDALILYTQRSQFSDFVQAARKDYLSSAIDQLVVGPLGGMTSDGTSAEGANAGVVARLKYDFASKYIIELSGRYDGNDNFAEGKKWGFFPAVSGVWIMSDEAFMQSLNEKNILNLLKLRASYGETGITDGVHRFGYLSAYKQQGNVNAYYTVNGASVAGFSEGPLVDPMALSWYTRKSTNVGLDFAALGSRLEGSVDYFYYGTTGYLCSPANIYSVPLGTNLPQITSNTEHRRSGYEVALRYKERKGDWYFEVGGNISYFNQLYKQLDTEDMATLKNPYQRQTHQQDYYGSMYLSNGLFQTEDQVLNSPRPLTSTETAMGDIRYIDANGDGKIDSNDERRIEKPADPHLNYGLDFTVSYKDWTLNGLLQGTGDRYTYMGTSFTLGTVGRTFLTCQNDYWTPNNTDARFPTVHTVEDVNGGNNSLNSDFYLDNARYFRLKNLQLTYNLKSRVLKNVDAIKGCNLTLTGTNLLTFSNVFDYMDPEAKLVDPNNKAGVGAKWTIPGAGFPLNRSYSIGVNINF